MKILKSNTQEENFSTLVRHFKCSFLQVREESGLPVRLFKNEFTPQKKKWYVLNLDLIYVRVVNSSYRPHQNERTRMKWNLIIRKTSQLWWFNWLDYGTELLLLAAPRVLIWIFIHWLLWDVSTPGTATLMLFWKGGRSKSSNSSLPQTWPILAIRRRF